MQAPELFHARPRRLSRAEYDRMAELGFFRGQRVELIHGIPVWMPPIGPPHAEVVDRLMATLVGALGTRARVRIQQPFLAQDDSEPEPDVAVVAARSYAAGHPDAAYLVIEVAETSLVYDRETKAPLYASSGVAEYWIVDLAGRALEVHTRPSQDGYAERRRFTAGDRVSPGAFADVVIDVADLVNP